MRIVTRPDFDGIVCAVLLHAVEAIDAPTLWVEPSEVQQGAVPIRSGDIMANLPYDPRCSIWFDHHFSNRIDTPFEGAWRLAPSAAGVIYTHYPGRFDRDFDQLVEQADKIDAADLTQEEVRQPEQHPYILLSMTVSGRDRGDEPYWNRLVDLLGGGDIEPVMRDGEVAERCRRVVTQNRRYREFLLTHTEMRRHVAITDSRMIADAPDGNRFLPYSLFPQAAVHVRIRRDAKNPGRISLSVGHSIFNRTCRVNVGLMLADFEGGGHRGAGGCSFDAALADDYIPRILAILLENASNEPPDGETGAGNRAP